MQLPQTTMSGISNMWEILTLSTWVTRITLKVYVKIADQNFEQLSSGWENIQVL